MERSRWAARPPRDPNNAIPLRNLPELMVIHHTNTRACASHGSCQNQMRSLQNAHFHAGYNDISYNFLIGSNGFVYEGRGWQIESESAPGVTNRALTIAFFGVFETFLPDERAMNSLLALLKCGVKHRHIPDTYRIIGHRQLRDTSCPGDNLFRFIQTWPRFEPNPLLDANNNEKLNETLIVQ